MPILFLLSGPKWVFCPAGATRCPDKREPLSKNNTGMAALRAGLPVIVTPKVRSRLPRAKFHVYRGRNVGIPNTAPKTVKISNFGHKFVPQGRLVYNIFTKLSAIVRAYR